jgi:hypothetical protein
VSKKRIRKRKSTTKYVWAGSNHALRSFHFIEDRLNNLGFKCVGKYTTTTDLPDVFPIGVGFGIAVGRGPLVGRMLSIGGKSDVPVFSLRKQAWSELKDELVDSGFLDGSGKPPKLHGFFDEEAASTPGPVSTPVLPADFELPKEEKQDDVVYRGCRNCYQDFPPGEPFDDRGYCGACAHRHPKAAPKKTEKKYAVYVADNGWVEVQTNMPNVKAPVSSRPVALPELDMVVPSQTALAELIGHKTSVATNTINAGFVEDSKSNPIAVRWASVEEAMKLDGAYRDRKLDGTKAIPGKPKMPPKRPKDVKFEAWRQGPIVAVKEYGKRHTLNPVVIDGTVYLSQTYAAHKLNIAQGEVSRCCREQRGTLPDGRECRWAEMAEVLKLDGAWHNRERDTTKAKTKQRPRKDKKTDERDTSQPPMLKVVQSPAPKQKPKPKKAPMPEAKKEPSEVMKLAAKIEEVRTAKFYTAEVAGVTTKVRMTDEMREKLLSSLLNKLSAAAAKNEGAS